MLAVSISFCNLAQEIEKMEIKTGGRKEAVNANEETRGKAKGWGGKEFDEHVLIMSGGRLLEAENKRICRISVGKKMIAVVKKFK